MWIFTDILYVNIMVLASCERGPRGRNQENTYLTPTRPMSSPKTNKTHSRKKIRKSVHSPGPQTTGKKTSKYSKRQKSLVTSRSDPEFDTSTQL